MKNFSHTAVLIFTRYIVFILLTICVGVGGYKINRYLKFRLPANLQEYVKDSIKITITPAYEYSFSLMNVGVIQHIDRKFTYDVIPRELLEGILFQGIHKPPKGTQISIDLKAPMDVYFFFHSNANGGLTQIFKTLQGWEICKTAPKYDIYNGDHGLNMIMYHLKAKKGRYVIPQTSKKRACFSIVFKPINK